MGDARRLEKVETGIYRRGNSFFVVVYAGIDPLTGKQKNRTAAAKTLAEARKLRKRLQDEVDKTGRLPAQPMTFAKFLLERFIPEHVANLRPKTRKGYEAIIHSHLANSEGGKQGIGNVKLDRLTRDHIAGYLEAKKAEKLADRTRLHHFRLIHKALECAVKWGFVGRNVADQITPPRPARYRATVLAVEQAQALLDHLRNTGNRLYFIVATALGTGARISELLALQWADIDMEHGRVRINKALAQEDVKGGPVFGPTKNTEGRSVPLAGFVKDALWDLGLLQAQEKAFYAQDYQNHGLVFCKPDGSPYDPRYVSQAFGRALAKADLPHVRFHDLRHTCASFLLAQGIHPKVVQEILGHATIQITLDTYSHLLPGVESRAAQELDKLLRAAHEEPGE